MNPPAHSPATVARDSTEATKPAVLTIASPRPPLRLLPHELAFNAFLLWVWARLAFQGHAGSVAGWAFAMFMAGSVVITLWAARRPTPWRWRVRLLWYPVVMGVSFFTLPLAVPLSSAAKVDPLLDRWDRALFGANLSQKLEAWSSPLLTDLMMLAYLFYFFYLVTGPGLYCVRDLPRFRQCIVGLFTLHGVGFLGYTLFPARGPHALLSFEGPLPEGWLTRLMQPVIDGGSNGVDVFPSLHLAVSLYLLIFDWRFCRRRFWWVLGPCVALWVSTVYLRYHYVVDLLAGALLALLGWWVDAAYARSALNRAVEREACACAAQTRT